MKLTKIVFSLLLAGVVAGSCIREDLDDCYSVNKLIFSYKGDGDTEIFPKHINRVELFVFDDENNFVNSVVVPDGEVAQRTATLPPLREGLYRIVCVGNTHSTGFEGLDSRDYRKMIFADDECIENEVMHGNDSLYYATTAYEVESYLTQLEEKVQVIEFASSHYDLLVEVVGVPADENTRAGSSGARLEMVNVTPRTDFENDVTGGVADYQLETSYDASTMVLSARTNIMRHDPTRDDVELRFYPAGSDAPMVTVNLADHIRTHNIDCSKHEVLIPIRIEFKSGLEVSVTVPDWFIVEVKPDFDKNN